MTYTLTIQPPAGPVGPAAFIGLAVVIGFPALISAGLAALLHYLAPELKFSGRVWLASLSGAAVPLALLALVQSAAEGDAAMPLRAVTQMASFDFAATMPFCLLASWLTSRWLRQRSGPDPSTFN